MLHGLTAVALGASCADRCRCERRNPFRNKWIYSIKQGWKGCEHPHLRATRFVMPLDWSNGLSASRAFRTAAADCFAVRVACRQTAVPAHIAKATTSQPMPAGPAKSAARALTHGPQRMSRTRHFPTTTSCRQSYTTLTARRERPFSTTSMCSGCDLYALLLLRCAQSGWDLYALSPPLMRRSCLLSYVMAVVWLAVVSQLDPFAFLCRV